MNLYPRSFLRLIVLGNVLAMLPLLAAIGYASFTVDNLSRRSDDAVRQASRVATLGYAVDEELGQMERILRQYEVLRDPMLLEDYGVVREEWRTSVGAFAAIPLLDGLMKRIEGMRRAEATAYGSLGPRAEGLQHLKATLLSVRRGLPSLLEEANRMMEAEREAFHQQATVLWQRLMAALLSALALTALLLWIGRRTLAQLWSRFERAVLALGEGRLDRRIRLKGPEDMQRVGRRLEWLRKRLVALETERTRVMRHVSHELKTPLATLREGASLLNEGIAGPLTPQQARIAGIMQTNSVRLQVLIDGLLNLQQASHARDQMETGPVRFDKVVEQTLDSFQLAARDRHLRISGSLAPLTVEGGSEALATLASNLLSNAIKFSPDGGAVRVTLAREDDQAVLDVADDGPGIPPEERERVFDPFFRGAAGKGISGAGLGLAIAREFALAHRGSLQLVESEMGAHFRVHLPLADAGT